MNWKAKALIQKCFSYLPAGLSGHLYFKMQYRLGNASPSSLYDTRKAFFFLDQTQKHFGNTHQIFFEVGSGWTLFLPMALWLGGAKKIVTVDLHRYLKPVLVKEYIEFWKENRTFLEKELSRFTSVKDFNTRFDKLWQLRDNPKSICTLANIEYIAPGDASHTLLEDSSVDVHLSTNVLEHIPGDFISKIFIEAARILKKGGLLIHRINPGDHFEHADPSISSINFLQFDQQEWNWWAGNQFAYHNRLRASEFIDIFETNGFSPEILEQIVDNHAIELLENGLNLHPNFQSYGKKDLATLGLILRAVNE